MGSGSLAASSAPRASAGDKRSRDGDLREEDLIASLPMTAPTALAAMAIAGQHIFPQAWTSEIQHIHELQQLHALQLQQLQHQRQQEMAMVLAADQASNRNISSFDPQSASSQPPYDLQPVMPHSATEPPVQSEKCSP